MLTWLLDGLARAIGAGREIAVYMTETWRAEGVAVSCSVPRNDDLRDEGEDHDDQKGDRQRAEDGRDYADYHRLESPGDAAVLLTGIGRSADRLAVPENL